MEHPNLVNIHPPKIYYSPLHLWRYFARLKDCSMQANEQTLPSTGNSP